MKSQCLFRQNERYTTAWMNSEGIKLGLVVEVPELVGLWELVEIFPPVSDEEFKEPQGLDRIILPVRRTRGNPDLQNSSVH